MTGSDEGCVQQEYLTSWAISRIRSGQHDPPENSLSAVALAIACGDGRSGLLSQGHSLVLVIGSYSWRDP